MGIDAITDGAIEIPLGTTHCSLIFGDNRNDIEFVLHFVSLVFA